MVESYICILTAIMAVPAIYIILEPRYHLVITL